MSKGRSGRKRSQRTPVNVARVRCASAKPKQVYAATQSLEIGYNRATANRMARVDMELFPYKMSIHQTLKG